MNERAELARSSAPWACADPHALPEADRLPGFLDAEVRALAGPPPRRRRGPAKAPGAASSARLRVQR